MERAEPQLRQNVPSGSLERNHLSFSLPWGTGCIPCTVTKRHSHLLWPGFLLHSYTQRNSCALGVWEVGIWRGPPQHNLQMWQCWGMLIISCEQLTQHAETDTEIIHSFLTQRLFTFVGSTICCSQWDLPPLFLPQKRVLSLCLLSIPFWCTIAPQIPTTSTGLTQHSHQVGPS